MDKKKDAEQFRLVRAQQEDAALNKVLIIIVGAVILEALLLLLNRYYVGYTIEELARAQAILAALRVLVIAFPLCFAGSLAWLITSRRSGKGTKLQAILTGSFAALSACTIVARFFRTAIPALYVIVPALAALALVYYLYQLEFFAAASIGGCGLLGVWLIQRGTGRYVLYTYLALAVIGLVAAVVLCLRLQKSGGVLNMGNRAVQLLPHNANYIMLYVTCAIVAAALVASLAMGPLALLYAALVAWLLILAVYYTVKLM